MTGLSHALLFTALLGASFVSVLFPNSPKKEIKAYEPIQLEIFEKADETPPLEEKGPDVKKESLPYSAEAITLYLTKEKSVKTLNLEEYVVGVLLAEMPSWYDTEALKAASVATRTYTLYKMNGSPHEGGANVCDNPSHCQAYYSLPDAVLAWSEKSAVDAEEKIREAVVETSGEILVWEGEPILALYHASSYLKTRSSAEVFGGEVPYLKSVDVAHENDENTTRGEKTFTVAETSQILYDRGYLETVTDTVSLSSVWEGNRCVGMKVNSLLVPALEVREMFGLKSANFKIEEKGSSFVFDTYGYGHGVGMSQNGANVLAKRGFSYEEILLCYYQGVSLAILKNHE